MREAFKNIPEPLQKQILYRIGTGAAALLLTASLFLYAMNPFSIVSCAGIMVFCGISSFVLFRKAVIGEYVVVNGECLKVTLTSVRKRVRAITFLTGDGQTLQVTVKQRLKKIRVGVAVTLYVAANMPVYEKDGMHLLYSYLALETRGGEMVG